MPETVHGRQSGQAADSAPASKQVRASLADTAPNQVCKWGIEVYFAQVARQQMKRLPRPVQERIIEKIAFYAGQPDPLEFAEPLTGTNEYRFRVGEYRIIFEVLTNLLWMQVVKRRDEAYK